MSTDPGFDATEDEPFGSFDDEPDIDEPGEPVDDEGERFEEETLARDDYAAADRPGMTPEEAAEGRSVAARLTEEQPDSPPRSVDEPAESESGTLVGDGPLEGDEAGDDPAAGPEQDAVHISEASEERDLESFAGRAVPRARS